MASKRSRSEVLHTLWRGASFLRPYRRRLTGVFFLVLGVSLCTLIPPRLNGMVVDAAMKPGGAVKIVPLLIFYALAIGLRSIFLLFRNHLMQTTGMRVTCDLRVAVFSHLQKLSLRFYEERQTGRIVSRVVEDSGSIHGLVAGASVNLLGDLVMSVGVFVLLFVLNWKLALIAVLIAPLFAFNYFWHRRRMRMESRRHSRNWSKVVGFLNERIANNRVVRAFATEKEDEDIFRDGISEDYDNYNRVQWRNTLLLATAEFLASFGQFLGLAFGAWIIMRSHGRFTVGDLMAVLSYLALLYAPVVRVMEANVAIQKGVTSLEKLFALLDTRPHIPENDALPNFPRMDGKIEFRDVSFGYRISQATLSHVSFIVEPGEMIALVGPSGAGKSTIITLLSRFYDPTSGQVLIDDRPIVDYNVQTVRRQVGIVMQDNILFTGSFADNIRYGRPGATQDEVIAAAKAANAHDFIMKMKDGYESRIGERGVSLSGGQRQRVAIARVLLKDPRILILDEATSALDSQAERLIQEATEKLMRNRTAIVIAHRLSTVVNANRILVMEQGRVVDSGCHADLLARPGLYRELYEMQFTERAAA